MNVDVKMNTTKSSQKMTSKQLLTFLSSTMRMSHIYQPLLVKYLVDAGGSATIRQLAQEFLSHDESQIIYYEKRIKEMLVDVLKGHGVIQKDGNLITLNTRKLSLEQKAEIRAIM